MSTYRRQVEIASGGKEGQDFELYDNSDGDGIKIRALKVGFVTPTDQEITDAQPEATVDTAELKNAKQNVRDRPNGGGLPGLTARVEDLEAIVASLVFTDA